MSAAFIILATFASTNCSSDLLHALERRHATLEYESALPFEYDAYLTFSAVLAFTGQTPAHGLWRWMYTQWMAAQRLLADVVNERGGVWVGNRRHALRLLWVDAGTSIENATTLAACRADFVFSIFSDADTTEVSRVAGGMGKITVAGGASVSSPYANDALLFGFLSPSAQYVVSALDAVVAAAAHIDGEANCTDGMRVVVTERSCGGNGTSCRDSLRVGALYWSADALGVSMCVSGVDAAQARGIEVARNASGDALLLSTETRNLGMEGWAALLRPLQAANVTVLILCAIGGPDVRAHFVAAMQELKYSPLQVISNVNNLAEESWKNDYVLRLVRGLWRGPTIPISTALMVASLISQEDWSMHRVASTPSGRGELSQMTSYDFAEYACRARTKPRARAQSPRLADEELIGSLSAISCPVRQSHGTYDQPEVPIEIGRRLTTVLCRCGCTTKSCGQFCGRHGARGRDRGGGKRRGWRCGRLAAHSPPPRVLRRYLF